MKAQPVVAGDVLPVEPEPDEGLAGPQLDVHRHRGGLGGVGPTGKVARDGELVAAVDTEGADHRALAAERRHRHLRRFADEHVVLRRGVVVGVAGVASVDEPPDPAEGDPVGGDGQGAVVVDADLHESVVEHALALAYAVPPALARRCGLARRCLWCGGLGRGQLGDANGGPAQRGRGDDGCETASGLVRGDDVPDRVGPGCGCRAAQPGLRGDGVEVGVTVVGELEGQALAGLVDLDVAHLEAEELPVVHAVHEPGQVAGADPLARQLHGRPRDLLGGDHPAAGQLEADGGPVLGHGQREVDDVIPLCGKRIGDDDRPGGAQRLGCGESSVAHGLGGVLALLEAGEDLHRGLVDPAPGHRVVTRGVDDPAPGHGQVVRRQGLQVQGRERLGIAGQQPLGAGHRLLELPAHREHAGQDVGAGVAAQLPVDDAQGLARVARLGEVVRQRGDPDARPVRRRCRARPPRPSARGAGRRGRCRTSRGSPRHTHCDWVASRAGEAFGVRRRCRRRRRRCRSCWRGTRCGCRCRRGSATRTRGSRPLPARRGRRRPARCRRAAAAGASARSGRTCRAGSRSASPRRGGRRRPSPSRGCGSSSRRSRGTRP